jgi:hypothetical protein
VVEVVQLLPVTMEMNLQDHLQVQRVMEVQEQHQVLMEHQQEELVVEVEDQVVVQQDQELMAVVMVVEQTLEQLTLVVVEVVELHLVQQEMVDLV